MFTSDSKIDPNLKSLDDVVSECISCIKQLEKVLAHAEDPNDWSSQDESLKRSRWGEIAGYEWIMCQITGELDIRKLCPWRYDKPQSNVDVEYVEADVIDKATGLPERSVTVKIYKEEV